MVIKNRLSAKWSCKKALLVKVVFKGALIVFPLVVALLLPQLCFPESPVSAQEHNNLSLNPWSMYQRDPQRTGRSPYSGPEIPALKWSYITGDQVKSSPAIGADGTIYVGSNDGNLYALYHDGSLKWSYKTGGIIISSPAIGADDTVYVGSQDSNVYAINPDGTLKWIFETEDNVYSSPVIGIDGTIYVGSYETNLYAINPDGTLRWSFATGGSIHSSPALGPDGTIYVASGSKFYAVSTEGTENWSLNLPVGMSALNSPAIGADGTIYAGSAGNRVYAINPNGTIRWSFDTRGDAVSSPAIGADGTIYVSSMPGFEKGGYGKVYAIDPNGKLKWSFITFVAPPSHWDPSSSSPAIGADGTIYVGSWDDNVYAINPDGTLKWTFDTEGPVVSSPAIGAEGHLYVGSWDGKIYGIVDQSLLPPPIAARIDIYGHNIDRTVGQENNLQMTFINTGTETHTFIAGASLWKPGSDFTSSDLDFEKEVTLGPGGLKTVSWKHTVDVHGHWAYQFAVWKAKPFINENLLYKKPSPVEFFYIGLPTYTLGDVNDDGRIDIQDVSLVTRHVMGIESILASQMEAADVNGDGNVDIQDIALITQRALGMIDNFAN